MSLTHWIYQFFPQKGEWRDYLWELDNFENFGSNSPTHEITSLCQKSPGQALKPTLFLLELPAKVPKGSAPMLKSSVKFLRAVMSNPRGIPTIPTPQNSLGKNIDKCITQQSSIPSPTPFGGSGIVMTLSVRTDRQTDYTQIRLLPEELQSDQGLHCLQFYLHHLW